MTITIPQFEVPSTQPPLVLTEADKKSYQSRIKQLLKENNAVLISHFYVDADIQALAEESGGFVGDSLAMAQFGRDHSATTLVIAGVRFMGETAKILSPTKRVIMPTLEAECSLDLSCPPESFKQFCEQYPNRTVVVYANTSVGVKALSDWVVTSTNALDIVRHLDAQGEKIVWAPDRYLGRYIQDQTGADMMIWQGSCIVHEEFKARGIAELKRQYPNAAVLVHPESPAEVVAQADVVGSTSRLIKAAKELPHTTLIVATDRGIFYKMQQVAPEKTLISAPTGGQGATCRSCGHCPWMAMNNLINLEQTLRDGGNEILIDAELAKKALLPLERMVNFARYQ